MLLLIVFMTVLMLAGAACAEDIGIKITPPSHSFIISNMLPGDTVGPKTIAIKNIGSMSIDKINLSDVSKHRESHGDTSNLAAVMDVDIVYRGINFTADAASKLGDSKLPLTLKELEAGYILDGVMDIGASRNLVLRIRFDRQAGNEYQGDSINVTFLFTALAPEIVINEIMYDPPSSVGPDVLYEWVELHNRNNISIDLSGWELNTSTTIIPDGTTIPANGYLIIARDRNSFLSYYGSLGCQVIAGNIDLANVVDTIILKDRWDDSIDSVTYRKTWGANGNGRTLERRYPGRPSNNATNWAESLVYAGTPCTLNSINDTIPPVITLDAPQNSSRTNSRWINFTITDNVRLDSAWWSKSLFFKDDFNDRIADGWTELSGIWDASGAEYNGRSASTIEAWSYYNTSISGNITIELDINFAATPHDGIGKHGGIMFFAAGKMNRSSTSGYTVDWIDRDSAYRIIKWTGGSYAVLGTFKENVTENRWYHWEIIRNSSDIIFFVDHREIGRVKDSTYTGGYFGLWAYSNSQNIRYDNIKIFSIAPLPTPWDISTIGWPDGPVAIYVWATDVPGNKNRKEYQFVIDRTPPRATSLVLSDPTPTKAGAVTFTITFSEKMDTSVNPSVTFGLIPPYTARSVTGSWLNPTTWRGSHTITGATGDGNNTISIAGAKDIAGNMMLVDTSRWFVIDTRKPKVTSVIVNPSPAKKGLTTFTVDFDEKMDTSVNPSVRFGLNSPYTTHSVAGSWFNSTRWKGTFTVTPLTGDGLNRIRIADGKDPAGNVMDPDTSYTFLIDATVPSVKNPRAPDIYLGDDETVTVDVFDAGTIASVWLNDNGVDYAMTKVPSDAPFWEFWFSPPPYETYYAILPSPGAGIHDLRFYAQDTVSNLNDSVTDTYYVNATVKTIGGKIAYLCRFDSCAYATEPKIIGWLKSEGWTVKGKRYNTWTDAELDSYDLIACSDGWSACDLSWNPVVYREHKNQKRGFIELSDGRKANAAYDFGYTTRSSGQSGPVTRNLYVTAPDIITAGYFLSTSVFKTRKQTDVLTDSALRPVVSDLADFDPEKATSSLFRVDASGTQGRFVWLSWFVGQTWYPSSARTFPEDLTADGKKILRRAVSWTQCGNPTGCV